MIALKHHLIRACAYYFVSISQRAGADHRLGRKAVNSTWCPGPDLNAHKHLFDQLDKDADGAITFDDFLEYMEARNDAANQREEIISMAAEEILQLKTAVVTMQGESAVMTGIITRSL